MSISARQFIGGLAALLLLAGLLGLLLPVTVDGPENDSLTCADDGISTSEPVSRPDFQGGFLTYDREGQLVDSGSSLNASGEMYRAAPWQAECASALGARSAWAWPAAVVGLVALAGAVLVNRSPAARR